MKTTIAAFLILIPFLAFAQSRSTREISASMTSEYTTEFNGMDLNFVNNRVKKFLSDELEMTTDGQDEFNVTDDMITLWQDYHKEIVINNNDRKLRVTFECKPEGNDLIIEQCVITGDFDAVVSFFVGFWDTSLNFDEVNGDELVMCHYITDKAVLTPMKDGAKIVVSKN